MRAFGTTLIIIAVSLLFSMSCAAAFTEDSIFKPVFIRSELSSTAIRPGDSVAVTLFFRNDGNSPAKGAYFVFVHFEYPKKGCNSIVLGADHLPSVPTNNWKPGLEVQDGPFPVRIPAQASEGTYHIHVGVYSPTQPGRFVDAYAGEVTVSRAAPHNVPHPAPLAKPEIDARQNALNARIANPATIETSLWKFAVDKSTGAYEFKDKRTGECWYSNPARAAFCEVNLSSEDETRSIVVENPDVHIQNKRIIISKKLTGTDASIKITARPDGKALKMSFESADGPKWKVKSVRLLDKALWGGGVEQAYAALPKRLGELVPAGSGLPFAAEYRPYSNWNGLSMSFLGMVKNGSALLITWDDLDSVLSLCREWKAGGTPDASAVIPSLTLSNGGSRSVWLYPLGEGDYVEVAKAYRTVAKERGWLVTWKEKLSTHPQAKGLFGAADFKPFVFTRYIQTGETYTGYTFDEAAQCAEHLKKDVGIDKAMYVLGGWINRGYDNEHPDILPAAPECGGNDALADCSRRVKSLGYLFGLHDNYQDMYRNSPSWDHNYIMRNVNYELIPGGVWAGGQAYLTCSRMALELAKRPQNLPGVKKLFDPNIYFIDTVFAAALFECHSVNHPLTRKDDLYWKTKLSNYTRNTFGLFGSEEGQEWAVPCADYLEGLVSAKSATPSDDSITTVPLFEMVYGDCVSLYTHQGDRATPDRPRYILDHIIMAEMPIYEFGSHTYFKSASTAETKKPEQLFTRAEGDWANGLNETDRFIRTTYEVLSPLNRVTAFTPMTSHRFLSEDRSVEQSEFGSVKITVNYGETEVEVDGTKLPQYGFLVEGPSLIEFYALSYRGKAFSRPTIVSCWARDGKPLAESEDVREFKAFGDDWKRE